jgi:hypothetical protein
VSARVGNCLPERGRHHRLNSLIVSELLRPTGLWLGHCMFCGASPVLMVYVTTRLVSHSVVWLVHAAMPLLHCTKDTHSSLAEAQTAKADTLKDQEGSCSSAQLVSLEAAFNSITSQSMSMFLPAVPVVEGGPVVLSPPQSRQRKKLFVQSDQCAAAMAPVYWLYYGRPRLRGFPFLEPLHNISNVSKNAAEAAGFGGCAFALATVGFAASSHQSGRSAVRKAAPASITGLGTCLGALIV